MIFKIPIFLFPLVFFPSILFSGTIFSDINDFINKNVDYIGIPYQIILAISALSFIPAFFLMMTSFTRIIIVFGLLRNALGLPYSPPNQLLIGLSLFLTFFIMSPVFNNIYQKAYIPYIHQKIKIKEAIKNASKPLHIFMRNQTRKSELLLFSNLSKTKIPEKKSKIPMNILLPAFAVSELKTAFQIGFSILIPFLVIDLVVASILMSLGMMMVPPSTISLPIKLILFVLVDGWNLIIKSISRSFFM